MSDTSIRAAASWSFAAQYCTQAIHFISIIVLSRLLTPEDVGTFSVAVVIFFLAQSLRNFGTSQYIVTKESLTDQDIKSATGVMAVLGSLLALLLYCGREAIGTYFHSRELPEIIAVLCLTLLLSPFLAMFAGVAQRSMLFEVIAKIRVISAIAYAVVVIGLAYYGYGPMSMAIAAVSSSVLELVLWQISTDRAVPRTPSLRGAKAVLDFGVFACGAALLKELSTRGPELVLGRGLDLAAVGIYSRAMGLIEIFNRAIIMGLRPVVLPYLSKLLHEKHGAKSAYVSLIQYTTVAAWPFFVFLFLFADPIIMLLFGDQWRLAVPVAQALCLVGVMEAMFHFGSEMLISLGKVRLAFFRNLILTPMKLGGVALAMPFGLTAAGLTLGLVSVFEFLVVFVLLRCHMSLGMGEIWRAVRPNLLVTASAAIVPIAVVAATEDATNGSPMMLGIAAMGSMLGWLLALQAIGHPVWNELKRVLPMIHSALSARSTVRRMPALSTVSAPL